jgi:hypothetical protein
MLMMLNVGRKVTYEKKNVEALVVVSKEIGLEVNADKTKYMFMARDQSDCRKSKY